MTDFVVAVRGLRMAYGSVVVLEDIDLSARGAEIIAVTGINGAGKSTLLSGCPGPAARYGCSCPRRRRPRWPARWRPNAGAPSPTRSPAVSPA